MSIQETIESNLVQVKSGIRAACARSGRDVSGVRLVAVTKYAEIDWVHALLNAGEIKLGESRPQQLAKRADELENGPHWHLIGHLQRNKVDLILPVTSLIHSVDSLRLLRKIESSAKALSVRPSVLLEVNVSGEAAKDGFDPADLTDHWDEVLELTHTDIQGLMTMAPRSDDSESSRPVFRRLREFRDELVERSEGRLALPELSMGMSGDFQVAIEEGATLVRIGSSLFKGLERTAS